MSILVWPDVGSRLLIHLGRWRAPSARKPPFHQRVRRSQLSRPRWDSRCRAPASPSRKSLPTPGRRAFLKPQGGKVGSWAVDSHSAMFSKPSRATTIPLFMRPSRSGIQEPCVRDLYHPSMRVSSPWPPLPRAHVRDPRRQEEVTQDAGKKGKESFLISSLTLWQMPVMCFYVIRN